MADRRDQLLAILQKSNSPVTGKQLSEQMKCSSRTIINYVNQINAGLEDPVIKSSQEGYYLNPDATAEDDHSEIPQDKQQRCFYILKTLLLSGNTGINVFDLADELMISYSLLKKEIGEFNADFKSYNISIISRKNILTVTGREKDKRKAMSAFIREMQADSFLDRGKLTQYFGEETIDTIASVISENVKKAGGYVDDFAMLNLILHLAIVTERLRMGDYLTEPESSETGSTSSLSRHIIRDVEKSFDIQLSETEKKQMTALIISHVHLDSPEDELSNVAGDEELTEFITELVGDVKSVFLMDFSNRSFLVPFVLHVQNLLVRLKNGINIDNPVKETIRNTAPFLYDVAVYMLDRIRERYGIEAQISDNEFTFIVIHLALEIERQNQADSSVYVLLYLPRYLGLEKKLSAEIMDRFETSIHIAGIVNVEEEIKNYHYDAVVSFVDVNVPKNRRFIKINPVLTRSDYEKMSEVFTLIQEEKLVNGFKKVFPFFFEKENFMIVKEKLDKYEAIRKMCRLLEKNKYVTDEFVHDVLKREEAISTGYSNFALPHAVSPSVLAQSVAVMIHPEGISWDSKTVHCVMLMAVDPKSLVSFQNMYSGLLLILTESSSPGQLKTVSSYEEFRELMLNANLNI